jgi:hypothetical protein
MYKMEVIHWTKLPSAAERLEVLRERDRELGGLARAFSMRHELTLLEAENEHLRIQANFLRAWRSSTTFRISRFITWSLFPLKMILNRLR